MLTETPETSESLLDHTRCVRRLPPAVRTTTVTNVPYLGPVGVPYHGAHAIADWPCALTARAGLPAPGAETDRGDDQPAAADAGNTNSVTTANAQPRALTQRRYGAS